MGKTALHLSFAAKMGPYRHKKLLEWGKLWYTDHDPRNFGAILREDPVAKEAPCERSRAAGRRFLS